MLGRCGGGGGGGGLWRGWVLYNLKMLAYMLSVHCTSPTCINHTYIIFLRLQSVKNKKHNSNTIANDWFNVGSVNCVTIFQLPQIHSGSQIQGEDLCVPPQIS